MSQPTEPPNLAWIHWKQAIIHKHRLKFWLSLIIIDLIYPMILMSFCWNIIDCANILEYKIYLLINPFIFILWFVMYAQIINICCGSSPLTRYSKCSFTAHSILSNWSLTIGLWALYSVYILIKMVYVASSRPHSCKNTYASFHLFTGFLFVAIYNIALVIIVSKEQFGHFHLIFKSDSRALPWNTDNGNSPIHDDGYQEPQLIEPNQPISVEPQPNLPQDIEETNERRTKYNFFGSATFETYFQGISTVLDAQLAQDKECSICIDEICVNEQIVILICNHKFHENCIVEWLKRDKHCPLCRTDCGRDDAPLSNV